MNVLQTPLERNGFQRYSRSDEIANYLRVLAATAGQFAQLECISYSVQEREILALRCGYPVIAHADQRKLRVLMAGSQRGASEAAGCEALLFFARHIAGRAARSAGKF